ncbi:MAG: hypothetical protein OEW15_17675 [Nitrospirota bacterium]|nr:hypothetical protein [Nitrospirota bacterium]
MNKPPFDEKLTASFVGKYILVGITYRDPDGQEIRRQQFHGVIKTATAKGILISLRGAYQGKSWNMPPDLRAITPAKPGKYTLHATKETIEDPDLLAKWTLTEPAPKDKPQRLALPRTLQDVPASDRVQGVKKLSPPKSYYLTQGFRHVTTAVALFLIAAAIAFSSLIYWYQDFKKAPPFILVWAALLYVVLPLFAGIGILRRTRKPEVVMTDAGLKLYRGMSGLYLARETSLAWDDIAAVSVQEHIALNAKSFLGSSAKSFLNSFSDKRVVKILVRRTGLPRDASFTLKGIEDAEQLVSALKERVPEVKFADLLAKYGFPAVATDEQEIKLGDFLLDRSGFHKRMLLGDDVNVPWSKIRSIVVQSRGLSLVGYYPVAITYTGDLGEEGQIIVSPGMNRTFLQFLYYLVKHSAHAVIDPTIINMLAYGTKELWCDVFSILTVVAAFFAQFVVMFFMEFYVPRQATLHYILLVFLLTISAGALTLRQVAARESRGIRIGIAKKAVWSVATLAMPLVASLAFALTSPATRFHLLANSARERGDLKTAKHYYDAAIARLPDELNINFDLGVYYRGSGQYDLSVVHLEKVYNGRLCWRGPEAAVLLPDALLRLNRYDEALAWCVKMQKECGEIQVAGKDPLESKRLEIEAARLALQPGIVQRGTGRVRQRER